MTMSRSVNRSINNNDPISYPLLTRKTNPNNPFLMFNESNLPNYTNPVNHKRIINPHSPNILTIKSQTNPTHIDNTNTTTSTASSISTAFNIIKGVMGVGLLTLPWTISNIGLLPAFILILLSFILSYICWILLCLLCAHYNVYTYRDIGLIIFGHKFAIALDIILLIFLYLVCILYVVFLSEFIVEGLAEFNITINTNISFNNLSTNITSFEDFITSKFGIITTAIFLILFPLSLIQHLDSLKYSSFLGIIGCFYTIGLVVFTYFDRTGSSEMNINKSVKLVNYHSSDQQENKFVWFWLSSFSVFVACFNTHFNCPALYGELRNKTARKFINISSISFILVLFLNFVIGVCGYFTFGIQSAENILDTLNHGLVVGIARLIMTLTIIGTYPLLYWNIKISINNLILYKNVTRFVDGNAYEMEIEKIPRKYTCVCSKLFINFIITTTIWVTAIIAFDVAVMISFMQSLLGNAIVFIFPAVFYLQMLKNEKSDKQNITKIFLVTVLCYVLVIFGLVCVLGGCIASVMFWIGYIQ